jgi:sporulation protein YlmC with PRC-barrel domain
MDMPIDAEVRCADGPCGQTTHIVMNAATEAVTHVVVKEANTPHAKRLVSLNLVMETTPQMIRLRCTTDELAKSDPFVATETIQDPRYASGVYTMPEAVSMTDETVEHESLPQNELAVRRGARVEASDGHVGRVDEFLVDPISQHITHLVLREGHLWGQKDVTIPVSQIDLIAEDVVYLKLDKRQVGALPTIPVRGWLL